MKLNFTKEEHKQFIDNYFQILTAHVIDENNEMYYVSSSKENPTKHDQVIAKIQAEKFGFIFGDGYMIKDYKPKATCANYERDNVLMSEMEQNILTFFKEKDWIMQHINDISTNNSVFSNPYFPCQDSIVEKVRQKLLDRSNVGLKKYNSSIFDNIDENYIKHLQDELLDGSNYCEQVLRLGEFTKTIINILQSDQNEMSVGAKIIKEYNKLKETK